MGRIIKCDNCGTLNMDDLIYCRECGEDISKKVSNYKDATSSEKKINLETYIPTSNNSKENLSSEFIWTNKSSFFTNIGYIMWVLGFIGGVILGSVYKIIEYNSSLNTIGESFNFGLMIYSWIGTFIIGSVFIFFGSVLFYLDKISNK